MRPLWKTVMTVALCSLLALPAAASTEPTCTASQSLDRYQLLKRLSLDLRHQLPTYEEYLALDAVDAVPEVTLDDYLNTDRFRLVARRLHEKLLWPNLETVQLTAANYRIGLSKGDPNLPARFPAAVRANAYRGSAGVTCHNEEQTEWLSTTVDGITYSFPKPITETVDEATGKTIQREGYVWVNPYWEPQANTLIKVCAYDAQEYALVPMLNPNGKPKMGNDGKAMMIDCSVGRIHKLCGAGPNLRWSWGNSVDGSMWHTMREQLLLLVDDHTVGEAPYSELLTTEKTYINGRYEFYKRHLADKTSLNRTFNTFMPGDVEPSEEPDFHDQEWRAALRNTVNGQWEDRGHSGVLTLAAFTLRFQTNRARANRFRTVFTRQYFIPSDIPEDANSSDCSEDSEDLTQRCTCRGCHQVLEPLAAHWGRVSEAGSALLSDETLFPIYNPDCDPTSPSFKPGMDCARFYVMDEGQTNPGVLLPYQFAYVGPGEDPVSALDTLHYEMYKNLATGPRGAAEKIIANGQFHSAMVQNIFEHFMGRPMNLNPALPDHEIDLLGELASEFQSHDDFKAIVKRIVLLPQYRSVQ